MFVDWFL